MTKKITGMDNPNAKHGHAVDGLHSKTYDCWQAMKSRCYNKNNIGYRLYGGKGIRVCNRWLNDFNNFLADMGDCPMNKSLDRFPNKTGDYEPSNCRWATSFEQTRNTSKNRNLSYNGRTMCVTDWAINLGISVTGLLYRLKSDVPIEIILSVGKGKFRVNNYAIKT